jgi:hypothetical protein
VKITMPVPFAGTAEQKQANLATHRWVRVDETEVACLTCDSKPWHASALYPCGVEPPRMEVEA